MNEWMNGWMKEISSSAIENIKISNLVDINIFIFLLQFIQLCRKWNLKLEKLTFLIKEGYFFVLSSLLSSYQKYTYSTDICTYIFGICLPVCIWLPNRICTCTISIYRCLWMWMWKRQNRESLCKTLFDNFAFYFNQSSFLSTLYPRTAF